MEFTFQDKKYSFPSSLNQITLKQKIDFHNQYGNDLMNRFKELYDYDDEGNIVGVIDETEKNILEMESACKNFSFFTGIPLEVVQKEMKFNQIANIYFSCIEQITNQEQEIGLNEHYVYENEHWYVSSPFISFDSEMTFGEIINAKQILKTFSDLGESNWSALVQLATIFLRKKDEEFSESFLNPNSERLKLMENLPLDIALGVGFFLQSSMIIWKKTTQSSNKNQEVVPDQT
ncbi:hypothetical protein [Empedobacter falsenii]|uniref:hypothetical protein n=1 Tax=Empedobacter falsenii TaxID=343874 RepID=UPI003A7F81B7